MNGPGDERRRRGWQALGFGPWWVARGEQPSDAADAGAAEAAPDEPAAAPADAQRVAALDWDGLQQAVAGCTACTLCETRRNTVFGSGAREGEWLLIGEAPGADEDASGEAFVGQAGRLLDQMLAAIGADRRQHAYIANVIKCRPPNNRDPSPEEVARCAPFLQRQIALLSPGVIVALGRFAAQALLGTDASVASLRGRVHEWRGEARTIPLVVTYHPAYLLREPADKARAWSDLCLAADAKERATRE